MNEIYYKNKYRIASARRVGYDYSQDGFYFVTICVIDRKMFFGYVVSGKMMLSEIGSATDRFWQEIPAHYPFVNLHEYVVMPNHVHGILEIAHPVETQYFASHSTEKTQSPGSSPTEKTQNIASLRDGEYKNKFGPQSQNLSSVIRGFKIGVTKFAKNTGLVFGWQEKFYDHIIRNEDELNRIRQYIIHNPEQWEIDKNNSANIFM